MNKSEEFSNIMNAWMELMMHNAMVNQAKFSRDKGLSMSQMMALHFIHKHKGCTVSDLVDRIGITKAAISQLLERLVKQGLISRVESSHDRRSRQLNITEKGKAILMELNSVRKAFLDEIQAEFSPDELEKISEVFKDLYHKALLLEKNRCPFIGPPEEEGGKKQYAEIS